ncbi:MAG: hypothetical protein AB3N15_13945 [Paracoccaceae bacterium]
MIGAAGRDGNACAARFMTILAGNPNILTETAGADVSANPISLTRPGMVSL